MNDITKNIEEPEKTNVTIWDDLITCEVNPARDFWCDSHFGVHLFSERLA